MQGEESGDVQELFAFGASNKMHMKNLQTAEAYNDYLEDEEIIFPTRSETIYDVQVHTGSEGTKHSNATEKNSD